MTNRQSFILFMCLSPLLIGGLFGHVHADSTKIIYQSRVIAPQPFEDKEEMLEFLDYWRENKVEIITVGADGKTDFTVKNNCIDMATQLKQMAAIKGKDFDTEVLTINELRQIYHTRYTRPHMINKAILWDGECWYYDFATGNLWRAW